MSERDISINSTPIKGLIEPLPHGLDTSTTEITQKVSPLSPTSPEIIETKIDTIPTQKTKFGEVDALTSLGKGVPLYEY